MRFMRLNNDDSHKLKKVLHYYVFKQLNLYLVWLRYRHVVQHIILSYITEIK